MAKAPSFAHDLLRQAGHPLDPFFRPRSVAVIGATETPGSVGRTLLWNLVTHTFGGVVYPVNPKRTSVLGIRAYPSIADVPDKVDLAVIVTPAATVPGVVRQCADAGVPAAIVISAGFKELGEPGRALEAQVLTEARRGRMRIVGPNCLGVMSPLTGLNATFAGAMARPGSVAFVSQSGALLTAILDWSLEAQVGFSAFVSVGSMLDVGWGDLIDYLGSDPRTRSILLYMETIGDARAFLSAAREVALTKPIIVIKAGRSEAAAKAAASHTGALAGSDEVLEAAFRRTGVLRVRNIGDLFSMAEVLGKQPRPRGPRLTIITNAGGPGVLATDALVDLGGKLAPLSAETSKALDGILPAAWSHNNPIDVLGDAPPERYAKTLELAAGDEASDGMLVVLTPQDMTDPTQTAEALRKHASIPGKPVLASWMGGTGVRAGVDILSRAGIPCFEYPDTAARAFCYMWRYAYNLHGIYETPALGQAGPTDPGRAERIVDEARRSGRTLLDEVESKNVLAAYGIPAVDTRLATDEDQAVAAARAIGFPVVLKLYSKTITHKTDVGGVKLGIGDERAAAAAFRDIRENVTRAAGAEHFQGVTVQPMVSGRDGYELILGSSLDPQFGPVVLFGTGGQLVEVFRDRALVLPPLNATLARRMMEQTKILKALEGVRGRKPVDVPALGDLLVRFGELVLGQPWIKEIDINPLLASPDGFMALDARVVLHGADVRKEDLPRPAIRPYPAHYVSDWRMRNGNEVTIRPIRPEDEPLMVDFHRGLSDRTVKFRFHGTLPLDTRTAHDRLVQVCFIDYDREIALVAEQKGPEPKILAVGRLSKDRGGSREAEFSLLVTDNAQGQGLGTEILRRLISFGRDERLDRITATILCENLTMQRICQRLGFRLDDDVEEQVTAAELPLAY
jgi:acetyltransferase